MKYSDFLANKLVAVRPTGIDISEGDIHPMLFDWQRAVVAWALKLGKAALFEECGLGKTLQQIEWARIVAEHTGGKVLILAPLAVAHQTVREGEKINVEVTYCRSQEEAEQAEARIVITNYDMLKAFNPDRFAGVVLDESSILKSFTGSTKRAILNAFAETPFRLACTATPAPNDYLELGNHAEFLGVMRSNEMIMRWFINDTMAAGSYRLKKHAMKDFWRWVTSWAVCISKPSDLGDEYSDEGFVLPPLRLIEYRIEVDHTRAFENGRLFLDANLSATDMWREKAATAFDRACKAAEIVAGRELEPWIVWCDTNDEADHLYCMIKEAVEVRGSHSVKVKEERLTAFSDGDARVIITKCEIAGFGLNWQHCPNMVYVGVSYSFEKFYQSLRRSWRFGQDKPVNAHIIYAESEGSIVQALEKKQEAHQEMQEQMREAMKEHGLRTESGCTVKLDIEENTVAGKHWIMHLGDCVTSIRKIDDGSVGLSVFSPPFSTLYIYSDSIADMGNTANDEEFFAQFEFLIPELWRVTMPGRLCAVHCKDLPLYMNRDGAAGLKDFPGEIIRRFEKHGWTYHSRVTIWKDPVIEMQRTKNHGLLYKNFQVRGEVCRQGMADYLVVFRKWDMEGSESPQPVIHDKGEFPLELWQRYASPVWFDIDQTKVLNYQLARASEDEKHICPLQLGVIERCVELWSNPGDLVFSPFAGVGSEGYVALRAGRSFAGIELKRSYFNHAIKHLQAAEAERGSTLFEVA